MAKKKKDVEIGSSTHIPTWQECWNCQYSSKCNSGEKCVVKPKNDNIKREKGRPRKCEYSS